MVLYIPNEYKLFVSVMYSPYWLPSGVTLSVASQIHVHIV